MVCFEVLGGLVSQNKPGFGFFALIQKKFTFLGFSSNFCGLLVCLDKRDHKSKKNYDFYTCFLWKYRNFDTFKCDFLLNKDKIEKKPLAYFGKLGQGPLCGDVYEKALIETVLKAVYCC